MKVLFVSTSYPRFKFDYPGSFVARWAESLAISGLDVRVIAPDDRKLVTPPEINGVKIYRVKYFFRKQWQILCYNEKGVLNNIYDSYLAVFQIPIFLVAVFFKVWKHIDDVDVVHSHWLPMATVVSLVNLLKFKKVKHVFTNWGSDTRSLSPFFIKLLTRGVSHYISSAEETTSHLKAAGIKNITYVGVPVSLESMQFGDGNLRNEFSLQEDLHILTFVGRLDLFKDPLTFIRSCEKLKKRGLNYCAFIVGDGPLYRECKQLINELFLEEHVKLVGFRSDVGAFLRISSLMVHISPVENTWATVITEAMHLGCPVILTDAGFTKNTFTDGINCLMVEPSDPQGLAKSIYRLLSDRYLAEKLSDQGKVLLELHGKTMAQAAEKLIRVYME